MQTEKFDIIVIGSGPAGEKAAIQASKLGKKTALIEKRSVIGGVCVHTGTLPSKTLRETSVYYSGLKQRSFYGINLSLKKNVSVQELMHRKNIVVQSELEVILNRMRRNRITVYSGRGQFLDKNCVELYTTNRLTNVLEAESIIIAVGTRPRHLAGISYDDHIVFDGESILNLESIPGSMTIIGGGVIGCEYASIFSKLGVKVTLIDKRNHLLSFLDHEICSSVFDLMESDGIRLTLGKERQKIIRHPNNIEIVMEDGEIIKSEILLITAGRIGNSGDLGLKNIGLRPDKNGLLDVDSDFRTDVDNVYAAGDIIGFPSLAASSMDQGRCAARSAILGHIKTKHKTFLPFGIYTIPEISFVGETEESLKQKNHPYEIGTANFFELPRGQISNDHDGLLKLLFDKNNLSLLGVHIIGERSTEIIHIGQAVMSFGGTIEYFIDTILNYPTIAEAYKVAALNGLNRLARKNH